MRWCAVAPQRDFAVALPAPGRTCGSRGADRPGGPHHRRVHDDGGLPIRGRHLRYLAVLVLDRNGGVMTPSEIDRSITASGFATAGRPGKAVSDALRWAVERGQVDKAGHGRYVIRGISRQTRHRYRQRLAALRHRAGAP
jgi:hypothetical protein